ncbi:tetratricopeptide repeat protein [Micromonospora sp. HM134]|uniref:tetratricopeptide repeat protein n=1 Tax=Micromonospora sp. HM134 TaxID=2583243 RepID=UPI00272E9098|nr:tetratricopeptide repeat protein [Micromonospora sp. HM134]
MLLARHQIVPFTGRERTLDRLADWIGGDAPVAALLVHGAGGQGKTRLAGQVSASCAAQGWAVWQVTHTPTPVTGSTPVSQVELPGGAVLAVVDYADRWPASALLALLTQLRNLHARAGTRVRVLMLARSDGYWWPALADRADSALRIEVDQMALPALAADSVDDRPGLFAAAASRFGAVLHVAAPTQGWPMPDLSADRFGQVLAVHMAALAVVDAAGRGDALPGGPDAVSSYLLGREQAYWHHLHTRAEAPVQTPPEVMHRLVVAATLTGARPRSDARHALTNAGIADTKPATDRLIDDHSTCYPPSDAQTVCEPLHPDRLGEDLIALSTPGHDSGTRLARDWTSEVITALLTTSTTAPAWTASAITVLVETAHRWPHLATTVLYPLIQAHPHLAITAGGATLTRLTRIPGIDLTILETLEPLLPTDRHIDLDIAAAAITDTLTHHRLTHTTDPAQRARLHATHAWRLANAGQRQQALIPAEEAGTIYRRLAQTNPDAHLPGLAASLNNLGAFLSELGRWEQALTPTEEAATIYRRLAQTNPDAHLPNLAMSLNNLGLFLSKLGRRKQALTSTEEAATIYRRLAQTNPDAHLPNLAMSLNNLGNCLSELGRRERALTSTEEAATIYRRLAQTNPDAHLPSLAESLNNLGNRMSELGRREQALTPTEESVHIRRRLAQTNPDAYLPDLAASLNNLGIRLAELGRREQALTPAEEATTIYRRLAQTNPDAYLPDLAASLNNLGTSLSELGRWEQALTPTEESVHIRRRLVQANPDAHLPNLAASLNNLGIRLAELGRRKQALTPAEEATTIYRRLAQTNPDAYLPNLAASLNNLGKLGRREQALTPAEVAVHIRRRLAQTNPDAHLPDLAESLNNLGIRLAGLGRREALTTTEESVHIRRRLVQTNPDAHLPDLAASLWAYAWISVSVQTNLPQALDSITEAIALYQPLAQQLPQMFGGRLFSAYQTLGDVLDGLGRSEEATDLRKQLDQATSGP